jgi:excisionase family DNA binding protein
MTAYHPLRRDDARVAYVVQTAESIPPLCVSVPEAARLLGCSERTFQRWLAEGRIPKVRCDEDGRVFILVEDVRAFARAHRQPATTGPLAEPLAAD